MWRRRARLAGLAVFLLLQGLPVPGPVNQEETGFPELPAQVHRILQRSCLDCHSERAQFPWYTHVAPLSWWFGQEVRRGKAGLNWSRWPNYSARQKALAWRRSVQRIQEERMPPLAYRVGHPGAEIAPEDLLTLEDFVQEYEATAGDHLSPAELMAWPARSYEAGVPLRGCLSLSPGTLAERLPLEGALLLVDGDLRLQGPVSGRGTVVCTGQLEVTLGPGQVGPLTLIGLEGVRVHGFANGKWVGLGYGGTGTVTSEVPREPRRAVDGPVEGIRELHLEFCRDDGELGERLERQIIVRWGSKGFVLWDPEFQAVRRAATVESALLVAEELLRSDPATSISRWRRRFAKTWKRALGTIEEGEVARFRFRLE